MLAHLKIKINYDDKIIEADFGFQTINPMKTRENRYNTTIHGSLVFSDACRLLLILRSDLTAQRDKAFKFGQTPNQTQNLSKILKYLGF